MDIQPSSATSDSTERALYRFRDPSPAEVGRALGVSGQHVKDLCTSLGLEMVDKRAPGSKYPRWRIPLLVFRRLRSQIGERHSR